MGPTVGDTLPGGAQPAARRDVAVLIADDYAPVRRALCDWLGLHFPQCRPVEAATAEEAVWQARECRPAVVLMDLRLPRMNGFAAMRLIKHAVPAARVVVLTNHDDASYRAEALAAGACSYVTKLRLQHDLLKVLRPLLA